MSNKSDIILLCLNCGNTRHFTRVQNFTVSREKTILISNGFFGEEDDSDEVIDLEDESITCEECQSSNVEEFEDENEKLRCIWEHRDKEGNWNRMEIDEEKRDPTLLKNIIIEEM